MQVSLDPVEWSKLTRFSSASELFDHLYSDEGAEESLTPEKCSCYDNGWESDSASQYFEVANALEHAQKFISQTVVTHLTQGIRRVLCENGHVDEFGASIATEGHYWLSASPETTREIWKHAKQTDWDAVIDALRKYPLSSGNPNNGIESEFMPFIRQRLIILELAASRGYGLLGHIG